MLDPVLLSDQLIINNMKIISQVSVGLLLAVAVIVGSVFQGTAQLNPLGWQYFQNPYQANAAFAGAKDGLTLSGSIRRQWGLVPGSPITTAFTGDYRMNDRVGIGVSMHSEEAGLIKRTRMVGTYAFHLPLSEEEQEAIHFGLSVGFMNDRVLNEDLNGNVADQSVGRFNEQELYLDADFGVAYTNEGLNLQVAVPNMKSFFRSDVSREVDQTTFFSAASYRFIRNELVVSYIEPKVIFRSVKGYDNLYSAGANFCLVNNQLELSGIYHSTRSATFGIGLNFRDALSFLGMYTTETAALRGYTSGNFEIGVKYRFLKSVTNQANYY